MGFSFISESEAIAKQTLPFGIGLVLLGVVILIYSLSKDKSFVFLLVGGVIIFTGGWLTYQSHLLNQFPGTWDISITDDSVHWQSPNETVDKSFSLTLSDIQHILVESYENMPETRTVYRLVTNSETLTLKNISGINLQDFSAHLISKGVQIKEVIHETARK